MEGMEGSRERTHMVIQDDLTRIKELYRQIRKQNLEDLKISEMLIKVKEMISMKLSYRKVSKELINYLLSIKRTVEANDVHIEQMEFIEHLNNTVRIWKAHIDVQRDIVPLCTKAKAKTSHK